MRVFRLELLFWYVGTGIDVVIHCFGICNRIKCHILTNRTYNSTYKYMGWSMVAGIGLMEEKKDNKLYIYLEGMVNHLMVGLFVS